MSSFGLAKSPKRRREKRGTTPRCWPASLASDSSSSARFALGGATARFRRFYAGTGRLPFTAHRRHAQQPANGYATSTVGAHADDETAASCEPIAREPHRFLFGPLRDPLSRKLRSTGLFGATSIAK